MARKSTPDMLDEPLDGGDIVAIALGAPPTVELLYDGYDALAEADRTAVIDRTAAIKGRKRSVEENTIAIGKMLGEVKERLPYGQFGRWLEQEFAWSQDTANRLMSIHRAFGGAQNPRIAESGASVLGMLAAPSVPEAARSEFKARAEAGPVPVKEAREIIAKHRPSPAPKVGKPSPPAAPAWKPTPQPTPEPELATSLQQAMLDWARTLPTGQRIFSLKDLGAHKAGSIYWPKAKRFAPVIDRASSREIADAAHWARLQLIEDNGQASKAVVINPEPPATAEQHDITGQITRIAESGAPQPAAITPADVCAGLRAAFDLPDASPAELLAFVAQRVIVGPAGPGKLVLWRTEDGRKVLRMNDGTHTPPWLELSASQAAWLAKELTDGQ